MYTLETLKLHAARLFVCTLVFIPISLLSTYSHHMVHTLKVYSVHKVFLYYKLYNLNATRNTFGKIIIKCWEYLLKVILLSSVPYTLALVHPTFSLSFSLHRQECWICACAFIWFQWECLQVFWCFYYIEILEMWARRRRARTSITLKWRKKWAKLLSNINININ